MCMAATGHQMQAWDLRRLPPKEIGKVWWLRSSTVYALAEHPRLVHATGTEAAAFKQLPHNVEQVMGTGTEQGGKVSPSARNA